MEIDVSVFFCWYTARTYHLWVQRCIGVTLLYLHHSIIEEEGIIEEDSNGLQGGYDRCIRHTLVVLAIRMLYFCHQTPVWQ